VRLVVNAERVVIAEARRTHTYLSLFGYHVDAVVVNRLLPDHVDEPFFAQWKTLQKQHLATIDEGFAPLPVLPVPWQPSEPVGLEPLREVAAALYGGDDPTARLADGHPLRARPADPAQGDSAGVGAYVLEIELPFTGKDELDLGRRGDELLVRVGPYRRAITLPDSLRTREVTAAKLDAGLLAVTFG
jgi:arsenite-transporting ATPase